MNMATGEKAFDPVEAALTMIVSAAVGPDDPVTAMLERIARLGALSPEEQAAEMDRLREEREERRGA